ncbi:hypothetical protein D3C87_88960 [compost metagenome]
MLMVFTIVSLAAKAGGLLESWREVPLWVMIAVLFFAGVSHFTPVKHEFVKMIPPVFPAKLFLVYFTGVIEIVGAFLLMSTDYRKMASLALVFFLVAIFPANYYAGVKKIPFRNSPPLSALSRGVVQLIFIVALLVGGGWI